MIEFLKATGGRCARSSDERGATAVEYALLVSLIAAVIAVAVLVLGTTVNGLFEQFLSQSPFN
jgi:pilus assembly protein Flp/PilA